MSDIDFATASLLAADLAGARVDSNEAMKALAYARSKRSGRALFDYLGAVVANGQAVIRSRQTLDYYKDILTACDRHLRSLRGNDQRLLQTFAWSLRLLRYYKEVPDAAPRRTVDTSAPPPAVATPAAPAAPAKLTGQSLLEVGATFYGKIIEVGKIGVLIEVPNYALDKVIGIIKTENLAGKRYTAGKKNTANVEVIGSRSGDKGEIVLDLRPVQKTGGS
jgi:hypothetical protein